MRPRALLYESGLATALVEGGSWFDFVIAFQPLGKRATFLDELELLAARARRVGLLEVTVLYNDEASWVLEADWRRRRWQIEHHGVDRFSLESNELLVRWECIRVLAA